MIKGDVCKHFRYVVASLLNLKPVCHYFIMVDNVLISSSLKARL